MHARLYYILAGHQRRARSSLPHPVIRIVELALAAATATRYYKTTARGLQSFKAPEKASLVRVCNTRFAATYKKYTLHSDTLSLHVDIENKYVCIIQQTT